MQRRAQIPSGCVLIFGGTFDPPHLAHATLPHLAAQQVGCDEILYVPAATNPLKADHPPTAPEHRLAMLALAISDVPGARICTLELERAGPSYTIDTLKALRAEYPKASGRRIAAAASSPPSRKAAPARQANRSAPARPSATFRLLIGCDQALEFHQWKQWREVLKRATPVVMIRPPWDERQFERDLAKTYPDGEAARWRRWTLPHSLPRMDICASQIRRKAARGESLKGMVSPAVEQYIRANRLYQ